MDRVGEGLKPWEPGRFDIHHINTGRGNCTFCILPDGTTMLIDAGELDREGNPLGTPGTTSVVPNDTRPVWEWIGRYVEETIRHRDPELDIVWVTHFHSDHIGFVEPDAPVSAAGYKLSGLTGVCDRIPFKRLVDRGYPDYDYPIAANDEDSEHGRPGFGNSRETEDNYHAFRRWHVENRGVTVERFRPGVTDQLGMTQDVRAWPAFEVRTLVGNGEVWTGTGTETRQLFPDATALDRKALPNENTCSCAAMFSYGSFRYFTGGDITGIVELGKPDWFDVESHVAKVAGPVDVAVLNHHGHRDTQNEFYVATMRPRVWIGHSWSADHPGQGVLTRMRSRYLYPGDRDMFATNMLDANRWVIGPAIDEAYRSTQGHVVVRVDEGGEHYRVVVLEEEELTATGVWEYASNPARG